MLRKKTPISKINLGFDSSPDLGQGGDKRQQSLLQLKDQIQSQLMIASAAAATVSSTGSKDRRRKLNTVLLPVKDNKSEDESSDEANRESPPTQIQSLSEESSGK